MIVPNKVISYDVSLLSKLPAILDVIKEQPISPVDLYMRLQGKFSDINHFLLALDVLFVLGKIEFENGDFKSC